MRNSFTLSKLYGFHEKRMALRQPLVMLYGNLNFRKQHQRQWRSRGFRSRKQLAACDKQFVISEQEGLAVASIARDDPSTLPGDDPFPRARMHRDRNAR